MNYISLSIFYELVGTSIVIGIVLWGIYTTLDFKQLKNNDSCHGKLVEIVRQAVPVHHSKFEMLNPGVYLKKESSRHDILYIVDKDGVYQCNRTYIFGNVFWRCCLHIKKADGNYITRSRSVDLVTVMDIRNAVRSLAQDSKTTTNTVVLQ